MKKILLSAAIAISLISCSEQKSTEAKPMAMSEIENATFEDSLAYYMGQQLGLSYWAMVSEDSAYNNKEKFLEGVNAALSEEDKAYLAGYMAGIQGKTELETFEKEFGMKTSNERLLNGLSFATLKKDTVSQIDLQIAMQKIMSKVQKIAVEKSRKELASKPVSPEELAFLRENKASNPNIKETASGLQYEITKEGTGNSPKETDVVTVHYTGKLVDGTVFDSSIERGEPTQFPLNKVIPGWTEGLQLLKEGGKATLYIPSKLGYGEQGAGDIIPGNATLIFDVELIKIN